MGTDDGVVKFFDAEYGKICGSYELEQPAAAQQGNAKKVAVTCLALTPD